MLKAAIIAPNSLPVPPIRGGGIQNGIAEIIKHYKNYKPYVFSKATFGVDDLPSFEIDGNAEHRRICLSKREDFMIRFFHLSTKSYFPYVHLIAKQLEEIKPDIIHIRSRPWFVPFFKKKFGNKAKIILHNHNNYFMEMNKRQVAKYLKLIDGFAGPSNFTINAEVLERFPKEAEKCFTIYNGVNIDKFKPDQNLRETYRSKFNIKPEDTVVLFVGRIRKAKGIDTLVKAVKMLLKKNKKIKLVIAGGHFFGGDKTISAFMESLYKEAEPIKDNVIFTGFIPSSEIINIYSMADILAVPSHMEAFGLIYAEAGAMEIPVIATKRGAIPEIVEDGLTGLLIDDPDNVNALAEKLGYLTENPAIRELFGKRARQKMEQNFTWETAAGKTELMYNKILGL